MDSLGSDIFLMKIQKEFTQNQKVEILLSQQQMDNNYDSNIQEPIQQRNQHKEILDFFRERADTFQLSVDLYEDQLTIILKDFVQWAIYEKSYSQHDVGKQIHKKMDINDLFISFSQTKRGNDETLIEDKEKGKVKKYAYGQIVKNEGLPCYKIQKGGKITAYMSYIHPGLKKQIKYECKLKLSLARKMENIQIFTQTSSKEKRQLSEQFHEELNLVVKKVNRLDSVQKELQQYRAENLALKQKLQEVENQNRKKMKNWEQQIQKQIKQMISSLNYETKIKQLEKKLVESSELNKEKLVAYQKQSKAQMESLSLRFSAFNLMESLQQMYLGKFLIEGYRITYNGEGAWTQFLFNKYIPLTDYSFKIKIIKTASRTFMIGVVDYNKQRDQRSSYGSGHANCYYSSGCCKYPGGGGEGSGFNQNQIVEVNVNRNSKIIKWLVNGKQVAIDNSFGGLAEQARIFVPYVELYTQGDILEWIPDH